MTADSRTSSGFQDRAADLAPALAVLVFHLAFLPGYGVFRDELYYMACGRRPAWGYVDHPPLVAWVAWLVAQLAGESHLVLRVVAALAMAASVWLAGRTAAAMGGGAFARALAALATGFVPIALSLASVYSMNVFDLLFWALLSWILVRALSGGPERLWLLFGAVAGLGLLNKISVLYLGAGLVAGLVLARRFDVFRSRHFWAGGAIAFAALPARTSCGSTRTAGPRSSSWRTPAARRWSRSRRSASCWARSTRRCRSRGCGSWGWRGCSWRRRAARLQALGFAFLGVVAVLALAGGKPYYLAAAYSLAFAAGACAVEGWTTGRARPLRVVAAVVVLGLGLLAAPLARPVLREDALVRYAAALGEKPGTDERNAVGRLNQFFADMHGWRDLAEATARVVRELPASDRAGLCVFGQNYGEAGAIEYFDRQLDLPPAISSHNNYWLWGAERCSGRVLVVIGGRRERLAELFEQVDERGVSHCQDCMPYENGLSIWVVRGPRRPLAEIWPQIKRFI